MKILEHFGVYSVCVKNNKLLCVKKNGGPYNNRYDLPGGSRKEGESLLDTLKRETIEETGCSISKIYNNNLFDTYVKISETETVHHTFGLYDVDIDNNDIISKIEKVINDNELNDSLGIKWVDLDKLNERNASPLVLKVLSKREEYNAKKYDEWEILK